MGAASNTTCPISGEPVSADIKTVSFQGKTVGFCCNGCAAKFNALTDEQKAAKLASK
ncbi:MAG: glutathione S-transferase [Phycisphaerales bacterium]|nr:glutathione S-transferase [Phycisphaerales bacterium]